MAGDRRRVAATALAADVAAATLSSYIAFSVRFHDAAGAAAASQRSLWSLLIVVPATLAAFAIAGLYDHEIYYSRVLHVWTLAKASALAFVFTTVTLFLLHSELVQQSRVTTVLTFVALFGTAALLRVGFLTANVFSEIARQRPRTMVVGRSPETERLTQRLSGLRGFASWQVIERGEAFDDYRRAYGLLREGPDDLGRIAHLFIDSGSVPPHVTSYLVRLGKEHGAEVYVISRLLTALDSPGLLLDLFEMPVARVRHRPDERHTRATKRAFDILGATVALVALSPLMAAVALAIKLTSRGPVFFAQERVGLKGDPFRFYKFRSMQTDNDPEIHAQYVQRFIRAGEAACDEEALRFKIVDDPRVTSVGALLRKYSLDELPQLWNVVMGDMSLVGPRPALAYEVDHYHDWHMERFATLPGISGLWQVAGRSRVAFDEMVLEDIMYGYSQSLLTDVGICLRTIPVVLLGRGAA